MLKSFTAELHLALQFQNIRINCISTELNVVQYPAHLTSSETKCTLNTKILFYNLLSGGK